MGRGVLWLEQKVSHKGKGEEFGGNGSLLPLECVMSFPGICCPAGSEETVLGLWAPADAHVLTRLKVRE
jgi:hypothetical protein